MVTNEDKVKQLDILVNDMLRHMKAQQKKIRDNDKSNLERMVIEGYMRRYYRSMGGARAVKRNLDREAKRRNDRYDDVSFGDSLIRILSEKGVTQAELAERLGVTTAAVNKYCKGKMTPKFDTLIAIARVLDTDVEEFFHG